MGKERLPETRIFAATNQIAVPAAVKETLRHRIFVYVRVTSRDLFASLRAGYQRHDNRQDADVTIAPAE